MLTFLIIIHTTDAPEGEEHASREETPVIDRRMTLLPEQHSIPGRKQFYLIFLI